MPSVSSNYARNIGFKISKGDYVTFLDDDDELTADKLEKQLELFDDDSSFVYSNYIVISPHNGQHPFFSETPDAWNVDKTLY